MCVRVCVCVCACACVCVCVCVLSECALTAVLPSPPSITYVSVYTKCVQSEWSIVDQQWFT